MESRASERNAPVVTATILFAIFGVLAMVVGIFDLINPIYPWGYTLPVFGHIALLVGGLSLVATALLWKSNGLGGCLGIISFAIAFAVNVYVGEHLILHVIAGAIAGLVLFIP